MGGDMFRKVYAGKCAARLRVNVYKYGKASCLDESYKVYATSLMDAWTLGRPMQGPSKTGTAEPVEYWH